MPESILPSFYVAPYSTEPPDYPDEVIKLISRDTRTNYLLVAPEMNDGGDYIDGNCAYRQVGNGDIAYGWHYSDLVRVYNNKVRND